MPEFGVAFEFIDTGMGDCTLVQVSPWDSGPLLLIDFGEKWSPQKNPAVRATQFLVNRISEVCKNKSLASPLLDHLFLTHADGDHWNKMAWLIDGETDDGTTKQTDLWKTLGGWPTGTKLGLGQLTFGGQWTDYRKKGYTAIADTVWNAVASVAGKKKVSRLADKDHDTLAGGTVTPRWSYPDGAGGTTNVYLLSSNLPNKNSKDPNPKSLVLMIEYLSGGKSQKVIIPGDAESRVAEPQLLKNYPPAATTFLQSTGLRLGHHASKTASSAAWLDAVKPKIVFASGDAKWGHPYCEPFERATAYLGRQPDKHWYACSTTGGEKDYVNHNTDLQACANLWYVVTRKKGETLVDDQGFSHIVKQGWYGGAQWRLQLQPDGTFSLTHTDQWSPP